MRATHLEHLDHDAFETADLWIGSRTMALGATITIPRASRPVPAVLFVSGTGPLDRDSTVGGRKPFRDIAAGLAALGIASIRFDKRSFVEAPGDDIVSADSDLILDALSALDALRAHRGVREDALFVLGHSLGGYLAPDIARRAQAVAGVVMLCCAARWTPKLIVNALRRTQRVSEMFLARLDDEADALVAGRIGTKQQFLGLPVPYILDIMRREPAATVRELGLPALLLHGAADAQIDAIEHAAWLRELGVLARVEAHVLSGLDHFLTPVGSDGELEARGDAQVAPAAIDRVAGFIHRVADQVRK